MTKCGWFLTNLAGGGAELLPLVLAPALRHTEVTVILLKDEVQHTVPAQGPPIVKLSPGRRSLLVAGVPILARSARTSRYFDVLVAGLEWVPTFCAVASSAIARRPVIATVHTNLQRYHDYEPVPAIWWSTMKVALSRCAAVVAVSEDVRGSLLKLGLPDSRIHVIPNPTRPLALTRPQRSGPLRILTVAGLKKIKGIDIALDAAAQLLDMSFTWTIVGDGPERHALQEQATRLGLGGRVDFVGFQPDPSPFYAASDVYVLPSRSEGFALVLAEAMAAGLPIVATRCGTAVEGTVSSDLGELVPNNDAKALATALRSILNDPSRRERYRSVAINRALDRDPGRIGERYDQLFAQVVDHRHGDAP